LRSKLDHRLGMQANRHSCPLDGAYGFVLLTGCQPSRDMSGNGYQYPCIILNLLCDCWRAGRDSNP
jgi:hypothetical protein